MGQEEQRAEVIDDLVNNQGFKLQRQTFVKENCFDEFKNHMPAPEKGEEVIYFLQPSGNGYEISQYAKKEEQ